MAKPKVFWTSRENTLIAEAVTSPEYAHMPLYHAARIAQAKLLPPERQKVISSIAALKNATFEFALKQAQQQLQPVASAEPTAIPTEPPPESSALPLLDLLVSGLSSMLADAIRQALTSTVVRDAITESVGLTPVKKLRVLIGGLLPGQVSEIRQAFPRLNLCFWPKDGNTDQLRAKAQNVDKVLLMTDFISHAQEEHVKRMPNYERVPGGLSTLSTKLSNLQRSH